MKCISGTQLQPDAKKAQANNECFNFSNPS